MDALIILVNNPIALTARPPALQVFSDEQMLELKTAFVEDITRALDNLQKRFPRQRAIAALPERLEVLTQEEAPLNGRMRDAVGHCFDRGYQRVLIIGGYNPTITKKLLAGALSELKRQEVILGPTIRGGFYLIGMDKNNPELFEDVPVGTDQAYLAISERLRASGLKWRELDLWYDISHQEDIEFIVRDINQFRLTSDEETAWATEEVLAKYLDQTKEKTSPSDST